MSSYLGFSIRKVAQAVLPAPVHRRLLRDRRPHNDQFDFTGAEGVAHDIRAKYSCQSDLVDLFASNQRGKVNKWHHYIPIYERYFGPHRGRAIRFLEIGVAKGGSLQMWRDYFGNHATIFGIDIDQTCERFNGVAGQVRIGSQDDPAFLRSVVSEMGGVDIVLDDGSHQMAHIRNTLTHLFPLLNENGIYMIEDLHAAYWSEFGGGYRSSANFFQLVSDITHDMHRWYHVEPSKIPAVSEYCSAIHVHDSIAVLEKQKVFAPVRSEVGVV